MSKVQDLARLLMIATSGIVMQLGSGSEAAAEIAASTIMDMYDDRKIVALREEAEKSGSRELQIGNYSIKL